MNKKYSYWYNLQSKFKNKTAAKLGACNTSTAKPEELPPSLAEHKFWETEHTKGMWLHKLFLLSLPQAQQLYFIKKFHLSEHPLTAAKLGARIYEMWCTMRGVKCGPTSNYHGKIQESSILE
jgi:hypothetical protein